MFLQQIDRQPQVAQAQRRRSCEGQPILAILLHLPDRAPLHLGRLHGNLHFQQPVIADTRGILLRSLIGEQNGEEGMVVDVQQVVDVGIGAHRPDVSDARSGILGPIVRRGLVLSAGDGPGIHGEDEHAVAGRGVELSGNGPVVRGSIAREAYREAEVVRMDIVALRTKDTVEYMWSQADRGPGAAEDQAGLGGRGVAQVTFVGPSIELQQDRQHGKRRQDGENGEVSKKGPHPVQNWK